MLDFLRFLFSIVFLLSGIPFYSIVPHMQTPLDSAFRIPKTTMILDPKDSKVTSTLSTKYTKEYLIQEKVVIISPEELLRNLDRTQYLGYDVSEDYVIYHFKSKETFEGADWVVEYSDKLNVGTEEIISTPQLGQRYIYYTQYYTKQGKYIKTIHTGEEIIKYAKNGLKIIGTSQSPKAEDWSSIPTEESTTHYEESEVKEESTQNNYPFEQQSDVILEPAETTAN